jgi:hypothetical protein
VEASSPGPVGPAVPGRRRGGAMGKRLTGWVLCVAVVGGCGLRTTVFERTSDRQARLSEPATCWSLPLDIEEKGDVVQAGAWNVADWKAGVVGFKSRNDTYDSPKDGSVWIEGRQVTAAVFVHRRTAAVIRFQSSMASPEDSTVDLDVYLRRFVDELRGNRALFGAFGQVQALGSVERRIAAKESPHENIVVSGLPAVREDVDFIDLDHQTIEPNAVHLRSRIIVVRTPFNRYKLPAENRLPTHSVVLVRLSASPSVFESHLADLEGFVSNLRVVAGGEQALPAFEGCLPKDKPAEAAKKAN